MRRKRTATALAVVALIAAGAWGSGLFDSESAEPTKRLGRGPAHTEEPAAPAARRVARPRASASQPPPSTAEEVTPTAEKPEPPPERLDAIPIEWRVIDAETGHDVLGARASLQGNSRPPHKRLQEDGAVFRGEIARAVAEKDGVLGFFLRAPNGYVVEDRGRGGAVSPFAERLIATAIVRPALTLEARVIDADGNPIADAKLDAVHVGSVDRLPDRFEGRTDADGRITVNGLPFVRRDYLVAWAKTERLYGSGVVQFPARPIGSVDVVVTMRPNETSTISISGGSRHRGRGRRRLEEVIREPELKASSLTLVVLRHDGSPARRTTVSMSGVHTFPLPPTAASDTSPDRFKFTATAVTDTEGRATFADLPCGSVRLIARAAGLSSIHQSVELGDSEARMLTLREKPGVPSAVRVVDNEGRPLPGARLTIKSANERHPYVRIDRFGTQELGVVTDIDGRARLEHLPAGPVTIEVRWASWSAEVELTAGDDQTIVLER